MFTPEFSGNKEQKPTDQTRFKLHLLSVKDETDAWGTEKAGLDNYIIEAIDEIENPPILQSPDGRRQMVKEDLLTTPELKDLYLELIKEYGRKANPGGDLKN